MSLPAKTQKYQKSMSIAPKTKVYKHIKKPMSIAAKTRKDKKTHEHSNENKEDAQAHQKNHEHNNKNENK
jgi:hypothetical protein